MPFYAFKCECGKTDEVLRTMAHSGDPHTCPVCGKEMSRDIGAEHGESRQGESQGYLSDALGVHPNQIAEARKLFPHHEFHPDGRMVIHNRRHQDKVLKELGYVSYTKRDLKFG